MPHVPHADARVVTRFAPTVHEDVSKQFNRLSGALWGVYAFQVGQEFSHYGGSHSSTADTSMRDWLGFQTAVSVSTRAITDFLFFHAVSVHSGDYTKPPPIPLPDVNSSYIHVHSVVPKKYDAYKLLVLDATPSEPIELKRKIHAFSEFRKSIDVFIRIIDKSVRPKHDTSTSDSFLSPPHETPVRRVDESQTPQETPWSDQKNRRRCELVDKEIDGTLSPTDQVELEKLQAEMLAYRRKVAPLPLDELRQLHQALLRKAGGRKE